MRARSVDGISRRDFLNGMLLASGAAGVSGFFPMRLLARPSPEGLPAEMAAAVDPSLLRAGNVPSVFNVGHWLRDDRLTFGARRVRVAPAPYDDVQGSFPILADAGDYEVIVVGSGLSGLATAFYLERRRPGTRVLLLDANPVFGGNAARDDAPPIPVIASAAGAYLVAPYADFLFELYDTIGFDWTRHVVPDPFYCYFFDDRTPHVLPGTRGWTLDVYGAGLGDVPYPKAIVNDLKRARQDFRQWYNRKGAPTDPADDSDPRFDGLAVRTLHDYLLGDLGLHPAVSDFYTRYSVDALSGTSEQVSAYTAISFLGAEYNPIFAFPGGISGMARHMLKWLVPGAIDGTTTDEVLANPIRVAELDRPENAVRLRQSAMVLRADAEPQGVSVVYYSGGSFHRAHAGAAVLAGQGYTAQHLVKHLISPEVRDAWQSFTFVPTATANVTLRSAAPLVDLGLGYNQYWWGSRKWADFSVADWVGPNRFDRDRRTVLTFYGGNEEPPEAMPGARLELLTTPFSEYEDSLREDLNRVLAGGGFDFDRDVSAVYVYRWGHSLIYPKPGFPFGAPTFQGGRAVRTPAPRHLARVPLGRISFAGQDVESSPSAESAIGSGLRAAGEVLAWL